MSTQHVLKCHKLQLEWTHVVKTSIVMTYLTDTIITDFKKQRRQRTGINNKETASADLAYAY